MLIRLILCFNLFGMMSCNSSEHNSGPTEHERALQEEETGRHHSGHAVLVVSVQKKIVIGSHGFEFTPGGTSTGVGYRGILGSWQNWTAGRTLQAIYRFGHAD